MWSPDGGDGPPRARSPGNWSDDGGDGPPPTPSSSSHPVELSPVGGDGPQGARSPTVSPLRQPTSALASVQVSTTASSSSSSSSSATAAEAAVAQRIHGDSHHHGIGDVEEVSAGPESTNGYGNDDSADVVSGSTNTNNNDSTQIRSRRGPTTPHQQNHVRSLKMTLDSMGLKKEDGKVNRVGACPATIKEATTFANAHTGEYQAEAECSSSSKSGTNIETVGFEDSIFFSGGSKEEGLDSQPSSNSLRDFSRGLQDYPEEEIIYDEQELTISSLPADLDKAIILKDPDLDSYDRHQRPHSVQADDQYVDGGREDIDDETSLKVAATLTGPSIAKATSSIKPPDGDAAMHSESLTAKEPKRQPNVHGHETSLARSSTTTSSAAAAAAASGDLSEHDADEGCDGEQVDRASSPNRPETVSVGQAGDNCKETSILSNVSSPRKSAQVYDDANSVSGTTNANNDSDEEEEQNLSQFRQDHNFLISDDEEGEESDDDVGNETDQDQVGDSVPLSLSASSSVSSSSSSLASLASSSSALSSSEGDVIADGSTQLPANEESENEEEHTPEPNPQQHEDEDEVDLLETITDDMKISIQPFVRQPNGTLLPLDGLQISTDLFMGKSRWKKEINGAIEQMSTDDIPEEDRIHTHDIITTVAGVHRVTAFSEVPVDSGDYDRIETKWIKLKQTLNGTLNGEKTVVWETIRGKIKEIRKHLKNSNLPDKTILPPAVADIDVRDLKAALLSFAKDYGGMNENHASYFAAQADPKVKEWWGVKGTEYAKGIKTYYRRRFHTDRLAFLVSLLNDSKNDWLLNSSSFENLRKWMNRNGYTIE